MTATAIDTTHLEDADYEATLERLRSYVEQLEQAKEHRGQADRTADANSLERAADLARVFTDKRWVDEVPYPKRRPGRRGVKPDSREQFFKWVKDHVKSRRTGRPLERSQSQRLLNADEVGRLFAPTGDMGAKYPGLTERAIRPLTKLQAGRSDEIPEVWRRVLQLADGEPPTSSHIAKALADHDKALMPADPGAGPAVSKKAGAERYYKKVLTDYAQFLDRAGPKQTHALLLELEKMTKARAGIE